jgi:Xaa-Pro aminopeptidase
MIEVRCQRKEQTMDTKTYIERRKTLNAAVPEGAILLFGQQETPRNYLANPYPFRQDSHFLYYVGTNLPGLALAILPDGSEILYGPPEDPDDLVWNGPHPVLADHAREAGIERTDEISALRPLIDRFQQQETPVHYLPPYRDDRTLAYARLLGLPLSDVCSGASNDLVTAVVAQREIKSDAEVAEIEEALGIAAQVYKAAFEATRPGVKEFFVAGAMQGVALEHNRAQSFLPIVSVRGEVLHNNSYGNTLEAGDLLLVDSGLESPEFYACDTTRTFPVSGKYEPRQKAIYDTVLAAQLAAIEKAAPGVTMKELHLLTARTIAEGLKDIGLMKGNLDDAVAKGAHAMFYVHGLGHMIGLDVHDMEDLGDAVGYGPGLSRSDQFGLAFLRLAKKLEKGFCVTFEPGVYFVPALIDRWEEAGLHKEFIDYDEARKYIGFGGVRIEDDILITEDGCRVLGPAIPKTTEEIEAALAK